MRLATVIDWTALWQTVAAAIVAGVGVTLIFSVAIYASARFVDLNRDGRLAAAAAFGAVFLMGLVAFAGAIVVGILVMTSK